MKSLEDELKKSIQGEVHFDEVTRHVYSVDASIFEIVPQGVAVPKNLEDLKIIVDLASQYHIPITPRGASTGITGGSLGKGLIIDLSKYFNRIHSINIKEGYAICEPGVIQNDLNQVLDSSGYRLGPDTSTGDRATLGGMLANNAAGARSLHYGKMVDHVQSVKILLSNGKIYHFSEVTDKECLIKTTLNNREGDIYKTLWQIKQEDENEIRKHFTPIPRRVSGYNLDELIKPGPLNISKLIAGSEGTLGIATEITMKIVPKLRTTGLLVISFSDFLEAFRKVPILLKYNPASLEMIDEQIIQLGREHPSLNRKLDWLKESPKAILIFEVEEENIEKVEKKLRRIQEELKDQKIGNSHLIFNNLKQMATIWELRKSGLGILLSKRTYSRAIAFLEDLSVPPEHLASFMEKFCNYLASHGKQAGIYGHAGAGCMHIRPYIDLRDPNELVLMRQMMQDISSLLLEYGGALSGEHGDGWIRSWLNPKMFGEPLMEVFRKVKSAFDPEGLMNPGKIIPLTSEWEEMRTRPKESLQSPKTFLDFSPEGGFELAADLCNGNGFCRKKEHLMCPSFQATQDEFHSTRARAQTLRAMIHKRLPLDTMTSPGMHAVMDLCLSCKGCKTECPSQVDMAKFKSEFLYHYQEKHGYSLRTRLFANIGKLNSWSSSFASLTNRLMQWSGMKEVLDWIGISPLIPLPLLAKERFSDWFKKYHQPGNLGKSLILINDTFTEFNHPEIGRAAVKLLNFLGYRVILPKWRCCGRPALSKGMLPLAKKQAEQWVDEISSFVQPGTSLIGLEPSCLFTIKDDYLTLIQDRNKEKQLKQLISQCMTLDEFLAQQIDIININEFRSPFQTASKKVKVHGHCYQKALIGMASTMKVLGTIPGLDAEEIPSGCCGMAGSFGYEKEHREISQKIGELKLFPAILASHEDDWIIANGMSCRHQIIAGTGRRPMHIAEALLNFIPKDRTL